MSKHLLDEYRNLIRDNTDSQMIHKGRETYLGDLYRPIGERTHDEYFEDLVQHTNTRVLLDPAQAVGGDWDTAGELQLSILRSIGLQPSNSVLDVGCGTLRAGRHFIEYLQDDKYTGIDISPEAIEYGQQLMKDQSKSFELILNQHPDQCVIPIESERTFDYIMSFWVCYDMPAETFRQFLHESIDHMHPGSVFIFSWVRRNVTYPATNKMFTWLHDWRIVDEVVNERGVDYTDLPISLHQEDEQIVSCIEV